MLRLPIVGLVALTVMTGLSGCLLDEFDGGSPGSSTPVDSQTVLAELGPWLAAATTQDRSEGRHWGSDRGDEFVLPTNRSPAYTVAPPYLTRMESVQGVVDWGAVWDALQSDGPFVHPDYPELKMDAIYGSSGPEPHRGPINGEAQRWNLFIQAQWSQTAQGSAKVAWIDGLRWMWLESGSNGFCRQMAPHWQAVNSPEVLQIAQAQPRFAALQEQLPDGQLWLRLDVEDPPVRDLRQADGVICPQEARLTWTARWTDLSLIDDGVPYLDVVMDAQTGEVLRDYGGMFRLPGDYTWVPVLEDLDPPTQNPGSWQHSFQVPPDQVRLRVEVEGPRLPVGVTGGAHDEYVLTDPNGDQVTLGYFISTWTADVTHPLPGTWTLERETAVGVDLTAMVRLVSAEVVT